MKHLTQKEEELYNQLQEAVRLLENIKQSWGYFSDDYDFCNQYEKVFLIQTEKFLNKIKQ